MKWKKVGQRYNKPLSALNWFQVDSNKIRWKMIIYDQVRVTVNINFIDTNKIERNK
jgi:hypothetical protein